MVVQPSPEEFFCSQLGVCCDGEEASQLARLSHLQTGGGFLGHVVDDGFEVAVGGFKDFELAIGAGAGFEDVADAVDG